MQAPWVGASNPLVGKSREDIEAVSRALRTLHIPDPAAFLADAGAERKATASRAARAALRPRPCPVPVATPAAVDKPAAGRTEAGTCTCCDEPTYLRLKGVDFCAPCGVNLIDARSRQLKKDPTAGATPFPVDAMKCSKRGHRPSKKSVAAA